jgi:radical SAM superfamily enzyme YgiQ (UPF0313 family)
MPVSRSSVRVVLVNPPSSCVEDDRLEPPLGMLYLAAAVRTRGYEKVILDDMTGCRDEQEIAERISHVPPSDVYGISMFCTNHEYGKQVVAHIRRHHPAAYIVLGGPNPSAAPDFTLADTGADAVVVGEGEEALVRCLESYRQGKPLGGLVSSAPGEIDSYPLPARDLVEMESYSRRLNRQPVVSVIASRGCPHRCAYCNSPVMGGGANRVRYRSPAGLESEIQLLREQYRYFRFNDDCFMEHPQIPEILDRLGPLDIGFRIFTRVSHLTEKGCLALKKAGCIHVSVGLESLCEENLRILGKGSQVGQAHRLRFAREAGLVVRCYFMVGLPFDSDKSIADCFHRAATLGIDEFTVYPLIPYPGSVIAAHPERFGYTIINHDFRDYVQIGFDGRSCYALHHERFGPEDVYRWRQMASAILRQAGAIDSNRSPVAR